MPNTPPPVPPTQQQPVNSYLANQQSQVEGENQYWDYLWKNHPAEVWKANPVKAAQYAAHGAISNATNDVNMAANTIGAVIDPEETLAANKVETALLGKNPGETIANLTVPKPQETAVKEGIITPEPETGGIPEGEYVYHAFDKSRLPSIKAEGLRPGTWFANSPEEALQSGVAPISGNRADLMVVRVPRSEIKPRTPDAADIGAREAEKGRFIQSDVRHANPQLVSHKGNPAVVSASGNVMEIPPEKTTGIHDSTIKQGGAIPGGRFPKMGKNGQDVVMFHDPTTGSTLGLPEDEISVGNVKQSLVESRAKYSGKTKNMAAIPGAVLLASKIKKTPKSKVLKNKSTIEIETPGVEDRTKNAIPPPPKPRPRSETPGSSIA